MPKEKNVQIRDPIHGTLQLSRRELAMVDHRAYQRLRYIRQLGLADLAYPGATHTRYAHCLGTLHVASRMFAAVTRDHALDRADHDRLLGSLRLAALFHDLGHAPLSHTTERFMPPVGQLALGPWQAGPNGRRASHEDYSIKILTDSDLTGLLRTHFEDLGVMPEDIAALLAGRTPAGHPEDRFVVGGRNWFPLLGQCVSSELDADRMDYLLRDAYYAGVPYGRYDIEWLLENLRAVEQNGALYQGLEARAEFGLEDYLLSRYHMFLAVYLNHIPTAYEAMLECYQRDAPEGLRLPADIDAYLACDDIDLLGRLRRSSNGWARRIVERRAYRMVLERREVPEVDEPGRHPGPTVEDAVRRLHEAGVPALSFSVEGSISKYVRTPGDPQETRRGPSLFMVDRGRVVPVENYLPLYRRYGGPISIARVFVDPDRYHDAHRLLRSYA